MSNRDFENSSSANTVKLVVCWALVGIPLLWGVAQTLYNASALWQ